MLLSIIAAELWTQLKDKIVEKLAPQPETTPETEKLQKIQEILRGFAARYYTDVPVAEFYDPINAVLGEKTAASDDIDDYLDIRKRGGQIPDFLIDFVSKKLGKRWIYPDLPAAFHLFYHMNLPQTGHFRKVRPWMPAEKDDIAVWDGNLNYGNGMLGIIIEDRDDEVLAYTQNSTKNGPEVHPKSGLLGYFRPIAPTKETE